MALRINYNFQAEFAHTHLLKTERNLNSSIEKLSTGYRINSAKDDAAGLFIADQLNLVANALEQGARNAQDGISAAQIAETTLAQIYDKLNKIYTKIEQAANDTNASINRASLQEDINKLVDAIDRIANASEFNGKKLLDGSFREQYIHYGPRADQKLRISIDSARAKDLGSYTVQADGASKADDAKTLASLLDANADFKYTSTDTVSIQGVNVESGLTADRMVDASKIAEAINNNTTLQGYGINAVAHNRSVASADWSDISVNGTDGLIIKIFVGDDYNTEAIKLEYSKGATISLNSFVEQINNKAKQDNINIRAAIDETGKRLVLETTNGETIAFQVETTTGQSGINLQQFLDGISSATSVSNGNTGSAIKVGELDIYGTDTFGYDFTGISSTTPAGLGIDSTGTANLTSLEDIDVSTNDKAEFYLRIVDNVIKKVDKLRSNLGSIQINLETIIQNNEDSAVQQREAESRIRNVDFAKEMAQFTRYQTLMQSGMAMLAQANQLPQLVLQLLR